MSETEVIEAIKKEWYGIAGAIVLGIVAATTISYKVDALAEDVTQHIQKPTHPQAETEMAVVKTEIKTIKEDVKEIKEGQQELLREFRKRYGD